MCTKYLRTQVALPWEQQGNDNPAGAELYSSAYSRTIKQQTNRPTERLLETLDDSESRRHLLATLCRTYITGRTMPHIALPTGEILTSSDQVWMPVIIAAGGLLIKKDDHLRRILLSSPLFTGCHKAAPAPASSWRGSGMGHQPKDSCWAWYLSIFHPTAAAAVLLACLFLQLVGDGHWMICLNAQWYITQPIWGMHKNHHSYRATVYRWLDTHIFLGILDHSHSIRLSVWALLRRPSVNQQNGDCVDSYSSRVVHG